MEEKLREERKREERERWWEGAELFVTTNKNTMDGESNGNSIVNATTLQMDRYSFDYSRWDKWEPKDAVTLEEQEEIRKKEEEMKNKQFEESNAEFCKQFVNDMEERQKAVQQKQDSAESLRMKGNRHYKARQYEKSLEKYMEALKLCPFEVKTLTNIAQVC
jgi:tetratricopeptide (TPR) repeat protein